MTSGMAAAPHAASLDLLAVDRQTRQRETRRRLLKVTAWTGLVALSVSRGGVLGWLVASAGVYALVGELVDWRESRPEWKKGSHAVQGGLARRLLTSRHVDEVDQQSKLSFPASDSPATGQR